MLQAVAEMVNVNAAPEGLGIGAYIPETDGMDHKHISKCANRRMAIQFKSAFRPQT